MTAVADHAPAENPYAGQGSVLLDIGDGVGALVVTMPAGMRGVEVEIRPADPAHPARRAHLPHVAVVDRPTPSGPIASLVFPELDEDDYELCLKGTDRPLLAIRIRGGEVTEADWPR